MSDPLYEGPAVIGGVHFKSVSLREVQPTIPCDERTWKGTAIVPLTAAPPLFGMPNTPTLELELPDGRKGHVCAGADFDGEKWVLDLHGEGPLPAAP